MSDLTSLTIDADTKILIKKTQEIMRDKKNVNFNLKDLVYLVFKRPEKAVDLVNENFSIEMGDHE